MGDSSIVQDATPTPGPPSLTRALSNLSLSSHRSSSFRVSRVYDLARQTCAAIQPLWKGAESGYDILAFQAGSRVTSCLALLFAFYLSYHPHYILPFLLLLLLRHTLWYYVYRVVNNSQPYVLDQEFMLAIPQAIEPHQAATAQQANAAGLVGQQRDTSAGATLLKGIGTGAKVFASALSMVNPLKLVTPLFTRARNNTNEAEPEEHTDLQTLDRILRPHIKAILSLIDLPTDDGSHALTSYQQVYAHILEQYEWLYDILTWNEPTLYTYSRVCVVGIVGAIVYCYYGFSQPYLCATVGTLLLTHETILTTNLFALSSSLFEMPLEYWNKFRGKSASAKE